LPTNVVSAVRFSKGIVAIAVHTGVLKVPFARRQNAFNGFEPLCNLGSDNMQNLWISGGEKVDLRLFYQRLVLECSEGQAEPLDDRFP